jgi:hypothetical protein
MYLFSILGSDIRLTTWWKENSRADKLIGFMLVESSSCPSTKTFLMNLWIKSALLNIFYSDKLFTIRLYK